MARAGATVVLAFAVCCLLVAPAPARRPADLLPRALHAVVVDREAAAEPLLPKPVVEAAGCGEAAEQGTALAVPEEDPAVPEEEEEPRQRSSLLCLVFRCGDEPAHAGSSESEEPAALDERVRPAVSGKAEDEEPAVDMEERPYDTDSDSDDEVEDGFLGWLWRLADRF